MKDAIRFDLAELAKALPTVESVTVKGAVKQWTMDAQRGDKPLAVSTIIRKLSGFAEYWRHLVSLGETVDDDRNPFEAKRLNIVRPDKPKAERRQSFTPAEAVKLLREARKDKDDPQLADLIWFNMHLGGRIESLCKLKVADVHLGDKIPWFQILADKTDAGVRKVPVHPALLPLLRKWCKELNGWIRDRRHIRHNA